MTGIERLYEVVSELGRFSFCYDLYETLGNIADQIERERECERDTVENLRLELGEARDEAAWVRDHGGLDGVKRLLGWVVGHCSTRQQLDFDFWLSGRVMHELGFDEDMADRDEVERRLLARLMPEGMEWLVEAWPRFDAAEPVRIGDEGLDAYGRVHRAERVTLSEGCHVDVCDESGDVWWSNTRRDEHDDVMLDLGKRINRPAPKVLDADGVEIREKRDVWWICEGDERGVHAERLRVETICPNGLVECSPYNGGTWVELEPSELYVNKPVPASDGRPLREGEHVYHVETGAELVVKELPKPGEYQTVVVFALPTSPASHLTSFDPDRLTHERPIVDTWERLEEDADATAHLFDAFDSDASADIRDLVRRARALAERGQ